VPPTTDQAPNRPGIFPRILSALSGKRAPAAVPQGMRVYAVGDIHGCASQLDDLTAMILADNQSSGLDTQLVFLGDYLDRGPDSKGVVARLLAPPEGYRSTHLMGNHDQALLDFLDDPIVYRSWRAFGAPETLMSYGVRPPRFDDEAEFAAARDQLAQAMPADHLDFLRNLPLSTRIGDYFFVHAGVRPGIALAEQIAADMLWIRDEFLQSQYDFGSVIVHGHTPIERLVRHTNRINVDSGAYATGRLTAAVLEGQACRFLST
jgi:serine/threonine protein phosphatase 1